MYAQLLVPQHGTSITGVQTTILRWSSIISEMLHELTIMVSPHLGIQSPLSRTFTNWLFELNACCHLSSESLLLLLGNMKLWDADSIARSVSEGTMRFIFLCHGDEKERETKLHEYGVLLPLFSSLKRHKRAKKIIENNQGRAASELKPFQDVLLPENEVHRIETEHGKKARQRVEQRWAFMGICEELQRSGDQHFAELFHLHYPYGMSSHVIHQDRDGTAIVIERMRRSEERRDAVELAHGGRLIFDVFTYGIGRAFALYRANKLDPDPILKIYGRFQPIRKEIEAAYQAFHQIEYGQPQS